MEQQQQMIENYINAYNDLDVEGMTRDLAEHIIFENVSNGEINLKLEGLSAFEEQAHQAKDYFKERKQVIEKWQFHHAAEVKIHIQYDAILARDLPNGLKKGDILRLKGQSTFNFQNGKIIKITDES